MLLNRNGTPGLRDFYSHRISLIFSNEKPPNVYSNSPPLDEHYPQR